MNLESTSLQPISNRKVRFAAAANLIFHLQGLLPHALPKTATLTYNLYNCGQPFGTKRPIIGSYTLLVRLA